MTHSKKAIRAAAVPMPPRSPGLRTGNRDRLTEAQGLIAAGHHAAAQGLLNAALADPAARAEASYLLGISALMQRRGDEAVRLARAATVERPDDPRYQFALGRALKAGDQLEAAEQAYRRAIELQPGFAEAQVSLGIVLKARGELDAAIVCYEQALRLNPGLAVAHANLAAARGLRAARDDLSLTTGVPTVESIEGMQIAISLDPKDPELRRNLATLLERAGRNDDAARAFNDALTLNPSNVDACIGLGRCLAALGGFEQSREAYEKWLGMNGQNAVIMRTLASVLLRVGEADRALQWADRSWDIEPDPIAGLEMGSALIQLRRQDEGLRRCRQALEDSGRNPTLYPVLLLGLNYLHEDPVPIMQAHAEFGARLSARADRLPRRQRQDGDRLRVGYVSGDFLRHSVSFFVSPLLEHHDSSRFDVVCYHNNVRSDHVTERLQSHGHRWVECAHLSDEDLAKRITADGIDILVDLSGPTAQSRILMFAMAPAPVQIAYLGYPTATGVPSIDFRITDAVIDPGDMPALLSEAPLHLPHSMFCYRPDEAPALASPPVQRNGCITFGSFNNAAKITDHTLDLWAAAMHAVPGSRLVLKAATMAQASLQDDLRRAMAERGIAADRLALHARAGDDQSHLALYNEIDIGLDTYPYNGATTTCEALWMGVPVVSRRGRTHTSRMGASLLVAIGRTDCVADSDAEFALRAATLAANVDELAHWRLSSRDALRASPLLAHADFTREFEALLERAWATPVAHQAGVRAV